MTALELADAMLDLKVWNKTGPKVLMEQAAAELLRLHAELERCKQVCAATAEGWRVEREELLEALKKPLAEWQISDLMADIDPEDVCSWSFRQGVYAAEQHHGVRS